MGSNEFNDDDDFGDGNNFENEPASTGETNVRSDDVVYEIISILGGAKALLLEGLKWRVGDGRKIKVKVEAWLPGESAYVVLTPNVDSPRDLLATLSVRNVKDSLYWGPSNDGVYTTRSGYWLGRIGHIRGWEARMGGVRTDVWRRVWNIKGPPKLRNFLWRACTGSLATFGRLKERHVRSNGLCSLCDGEDESIVHAIFLCSNVRGIWSHSPFSSLLSDAPLNSFEDLLLWICSKFDNDDLLLFVAMAWGAWSYRNSVIFNEPWQNKDVGVLGFVQLVRDYSGYVKAVFTHASGAFVRSLGSWVTPAAGWVRIRHCSA
uniref:Reverse transcriptase zinc-binding domain-containing protein n=1 Tax=Chenopodium quinoa TaxID=63459 RepID=A0A803N456_CHEQI